MKKIKRITSALLAIIMALGALTVAPFTASALSKDDIIKTVLNYRNLWNTSGWNYSDVFFADFDFDGHLEILIGNREPIHSETYCIYRVDAENNCLKKMNGYLNGSSLLNQQEYSIYYDKQNYFYINHHFYNNYPATYEYYEKISISKDTINNNILFRHTTVDNSAPGGGSQEYAVNNNGTLSKVTKSTYDSKLKSYFSNLTKVESKYKFIQIEKSDSYTIAYNKLKESYEAFSYKKIAPTTVKLNRSTLTLGVGEKYGLIKTISPSTANQSCTWKSSNSSIASVDNSGKVTAKKAGTANITAKTTNGKTATCKVTVKAAPSSVKISKSSLTLGKGETFTVSQSTNSGSYAWGFSWSSSNNSVATVTRGSANKAKITAKGNGTAYIKIKTYNGKTAQCKVTVKNAPSSVKTNPASVTLGKGETYTINETTNSGAYANAANLKWSSTNTSVATVTKGSGNKAKITAKNNGTAYIKIKLYNGKTAQCKVTVKSAPTSVKTKPTSVTLGKGETYTISETTNSGSYANAANLKWSSTNTSVATVTKGSGNKAKITTKNNGTAYIKIKLYNGKTAQCKVTVKPAPTSVKLSKSSITLDVGKSYTISESTNSGSYANAANLKWSSSNSSVATVKKGSGNKAIITAKKVGTTTVTIKLFNGKTAQCKVTVKKKVTGIPNHEGISSVEQSIFKDMNNARKKEGVAPLKWDSELYPAAKIRANEHVYWDTDGNQSYYAHNRPNGEYYWTVFEETGLGWAPWTVHGEILTIDDKNNLFQGWMDSPPHRGAILRAEYTHVVICVVKHGDDYYACGLFHGAKL